MHFGLYVHFYCPLVSFIGNTMNYLNDNIKCKKSLRSSRTTAIANDPSLSASPSPAKSQGRDDLEIEVKIDVVKTD